MTIVPGRRVTGKEPKKTATEYGDDRRCSYPGCSTVMSRYNRGDRCYPHARWEVPRLRGKSIR
jgi:hypothetical protein